MNKKFKKTIVALISAAIVATTASISVCAATKTDTTTKSTPYGTMTGKLTGWGAGAVAITEVPTPAKLIITGVQGDNTTYFPHIVNSDDDTTRVEATTGELGNIGVLSSFWGSHEVQDGVNGYGAYTAVTNVL